MMTWHSQYAGVGHQLWHSTFLSREPPSQDSPVSTLDEGASSKGSCGHWGQTLETKQSAIVWLVMQNLDRLLQTMEMGEMKLALLQQLISQNQVDVFVCSELGTCWDVVNYEDRLPQKTRG